MKNLLLSLSAIALVFVFTSCNKDPKSAGEEVGKKYCECQKLSEKEGSKNEKAAIKCQLELRKMTAEYSAKFVMKKADMKKYEKSGERYVEKKCSSSDEYDEYDEYENNYNDYDDNTVKEEPTPDPAVPDYEY